MNEKMCEIAFGIITPAGEAKFLAKDALSKAKDGDIAQAYSLLEIARTTLNEAHRFQTELIQQEVNDEKVEMSVLLVHSQDHLMTTMSYIDLAEEFISMYDLIHSK